MTVYAVKNDEGKWGFCEIGKPHWETGFGTLWAELNKPYAQQTADDIGGHVVELTEAPEKVIVSAEEAEMLERAQGKAFPAHIFDSGAAGSLPGSQDRLIRAYVIGWVVAKPKQYLVKVKGRFERPTYYALRFNEYLAFGYREQDQQKLSDYPAYPFTDDEIIKYGLQDCEKEEVSNKGERNE